MNNALYPQAKFFEIAIKTLAGLEDVLCTELQTLGVTILSKGRRLVICEGDMEDVYRINLCVRTALKVLIPIKKFSSRDDMALYRNVKNIPWNRFFSHEDTFAIDYTVYSPYFSHSQYPALRTKDAIVDYFRETQDRRPNVDVKNPDIQIHLHISEDQCTIHLDSSGGSLHRRGYKLEVGRAPLSEVLAAGMLLLAGYDGTKDFADPMCGSGTLAIEAALIAANLPVNYRRPHFSFQNWSNFDPEIWDDIVQKALEKQRKPTVTIYANDLDRDAFEITRDNATRAGVESFTQFSNQDISSLDWSINNGILVVNPPYGERITEKDIIELYQKIGDFLKHKMTGSTAYVLSSNLYALKYVGLKPSQKLTLINGTLECRFAKFEIYSGSRKTLSRS